MWFRADEFVNGEIRHNSRLLGSFLTLAGGYCSNVCVNGHFNSIMTLLQSDAMSLKPPF
jgi:hypothetical protein